MTTQPARTSDVGGLLRTWRQRRRLTQLELANSSQVSTRHLSFIENGRAQPTKQMLLHLAEHLDIPLRERNGVLLAGGYAPAYPEHALTETPMAVISGAINRVLDAHDPFPAVVVDRRWDLVASNTAAGLLLEGVADHLLEPPINVIRASLHPEGMAGRILNLAEWRGHLLAQLGRQAQATGDPGLAALLEEFAALPGDVEVPDGPHELVIPLRCTVRGHELSLISMTTVFGTPLEVTVSELAIEAFYPADARTAQTLRVLGENEPPAAR
ncbi:helix-turn-helix transcriptional regulator [Brevibacterium daeguense]|uniref:Helix-turn-helix transcriptional regulator n=1 Tax=Brevibacterium daeguense TaxID=909936 RepID=A0ABP8EH39_9MICO|nr:helix-turn-helix transcriptional regulator [Brevibacterium daeguense]